MSITLVVGQYQRNIFSWTTDSRTPTATVLRWEGQLNWHWWPQLDPYSSSSWGLLYWPTSSLASPILLLERLFTLLRDLLQPCPQCTLIRPPERFDCLSTRAENPAPEPFKAGSKSPLKHRWQGPLAAPCYTCNRVSLEAQQPRYQVIHPIKRPCMVLSSVDPHQGLRNLTAPPQQQHTSPSK